MCDFQPGDVVKAVGVPDGDKMGEQPFSTNIRRGEVVNVAAVHCACWRGLCGLDISSRDPGTGGYWDARAFRRVYRPDGNFISKLLEPVDLGTEVR